MQTPPRKGALAVQSRSVRWNALTRVIEAAERMLEELGPEKTSIPALAEISEVPRAAIYPFFPDKIRAIRAYRPDTHAAPRDAIANSGAARTRTLHTWERTVIDTCVGLLQRPSSSERASSERLFQRQPTVRPMPPRTHRLDSCYATQPRDLANFRRCRCRRTWRRLPLKSLLAA